MCRYLSCLDKIGTGAQHPIWIRCANSILRQSHTKCTILPPTVDHNWPKRFLGAHLKYYIRKKKSLAVERKNFHEPNVIQC